MKLCPRLSSSLVLDKYLWLRRKDSTKTTILQTLYAKIMHPCKYSLKNLVVPNKNYTFAAPELNLMHNNMSNIESTKGEIVMYQPDETIRLEVRVESETVWLTQQQISDLFLRDRTVINRHINNVFKEGECDKESNVHFLHIPNSDKPVMYYSLDVIISVGYRVKSLNGTKFRRWANGVLKQYLLRGYAAPSITVSEITTASSSSTMWFTFSVPAWKMQARSSSLTFACKRPQPRNCWIISDKSIPRRDDVCLTFCAFS